MQVDTLSVVNLENIRLITPRRMNDGKTLCFRAITAHCRPDHISPEVRQKSSRTGVVPGVKA